VVKIEKQILITNSSTLTFGFVPHKHWVQAKRHRLWFSTKICSCYSTKTNANSVVIILKLNLTSMRNIFIKGVWCSTKTTLNVYISHRSQIQVENKDQAIYISFRWSNNYMSLLRTTTCDALFVPSGKTAPYLKNMLWIGRIRLNTQCFALYVKFSEVNLGSPWSHFNFMTLKIYKSRDRIKICGCKIL